MLQEQNSRKIIYLAEDDEDDRILFLDALRELHPEIAVKVSEDGQQLLNNLHNTAWDQPEIIFLDINMPCKNGFECLKEIRTGEHFFNGTKIIMFSTSSSLLHIELSYKLGADYYAVKPGSFQELKELLHEIMAIDWNTASRDKAEFLLVCKKIDTV
ncbi:response regulator [Flavobacterium sp. 17A]|uniref:Response regulator n=1 Tax=Flavobacterium potami TaxID=2872310 RepID=A0A9X1KSE2_9FLAO|nr:response regulator [Flavobacterium potami]MBZ4037510.1 response regulator [Flavobacterium potami]